jgi:membrane protein
MQQRGTTAGTAGSPASLSARDWWTAAREAYAESGRDNAGLLAAGVAFYAFLALAPMLAAMLLTWGLVADPRDVQDTVRGLASSLPRDAADLIAGQLQQVAGTAGAKKGAGLGLALVLALYGAMSGAKAVMTALNVIHGEAEGRGFLAMNLTALAITAGGVLAALAGVGTIAIIAFVEKLMAGMGELAHVAARAGTLGVAALVLLTVVSAVYAYGPNRHPRRWRWISWGAAVATLLWLAATGLFSLYVAHVANYNATYGSLGAVVALLTWLYVSAYVVLLGAELNEALEERARGAVSAR